MILKHLTSSFCSNKAISRFVTGQFPSALHHSRPIHSSITNNGITVVSESMPTKISTISVFIKCGSRNQTQQSSGTAHFLEHLHFKGTSNRNRLELELQVQNMGGNLNAYTSRQNTCYMMTIFKEDVHRAVNIIGDMITNSSYRRQDIDNQRGTIHRELIETQKSQPLETTIQIAHKGVFQNHQIGLPILGSIQNMQTISKAMIQQYHNNNYVGQNIIVVAVGPINHDQLIESVQKSIKVPKISSSAKSERIKPEFFSGIGSMQSHLTDLVNMAIINEAPSFFDNDFFAYLLLLRIISDRPETEFQLEIMKQSSSFRFQKHLAKYEFIKKQKGFYSSYWDTGIYGNYILCQPKQTKNVLKLCMEAYNYYANKVTDQQLERAKRRVYVQILQQQNQNDLTQSIGNNLMYYNRCVSTKQVAERISCVTSKALQEVAKRIISAQKLHLSFWGNLKGIPYLQK